MGDCASAIRHNGCNQLLRAPLSYNLPLQAEAFDDKATRPFFAGLLPEGDKRKLIAQTLHVSRQNDFALLDSIGGAS